MLLQSVYISMFLVHTKIRGDVMDKKEIEKLQQKKSHEEFNSITEKVKVENKNQEHNVKKEGLQPMNQKR